MAPLEQRRSIYEWLGLEIQLEGNLALRFFGIFVLHKAVRIILRSGLLLAIEGPHELPIVHRCNEENLERLAEVRQALLVATAMHAENISDGKEIAAAQLMINTPKKACSYAGAEWVEVDQDGAIASTK